MAHISLDINTVKKHIKTQIWIRDNKELYDFLYDYKDEIEKEIDLELEWARLDNKKASRITVYKDFDIKKNTNWDEAIKWHLDTACKFQESFNNKLRKFD